jgi:hypothetical protein
MTEPTQAEKCAELAKAMGWAMQEVKPSEFCLIAPDGSYGCIHGEPEDIWTCERLPDPYTDHEACHALKVWIAADDALFDVAIKNAWKLSGEKIDSWRGRDDLRVKVFMTADPAIIAEAAWRSIQKGNSE